jgi:hypothetical protein
MRERIKIGRLKSAKLFRLVSLSWILISFLYQAKRQSQLNHVYYYIILYHRSIYPIPSWIDVTSRAISMCMVQRWAFYPTRRGNPIQKIMISWLVVWNILYFSIFWEFHHPIWLSYFSEGWLNHQPVSHLIFRETQIFIMHQCHNFHTEPHLNGDWKMSCRATVHGNCATILEEGYPLVILVYQRVPSGKLT